MAAALARREMRREAAFLWMMPFDAARSSVRTAAWTACFVAAGSAWTMASRAFFTADLRAVRTCTFLVRRFWDCRLRFSAERMFANVKSPESRGWKRGYLPPGARRVKRSRARPNLRAASSRRPTPTEVLRACVRVRLLACGCAKHGPLRRPWRNGPRDVCTAEPRATRPHETLFGRLIHLRRLHRTHIGFRRRQCDSESEDRTVTT